MTRLRAIVGENDAEVLAEFRTFRTGLARHRRGGSLMDDRTWLRRHQNGQVALVFEHDGKFSAGAVPENGS